MYDAPGIGLAAPQVGVTRRLIVLDCVKDEGEEPRPLVMFNPEVVARSDETNTYEEGCLSIPDQYADVTRPKIVDVRWIDRDGNAGRNLRRALGDLRAARDRPSERQALHRLSRRDAAADDHKAHAKAQARAGARVRAVLRWPDKRLRTPAVPVAEITDATHAIWDEMIAVMEAMPGVGLAATQLGEMQALAVVDASEARGQAVRMANPEILHASVQLREHQEASPCLPGVSAGDRAAPRGDGAVSQCIGRDRGARFRRALGHIRAAPDRPFAGADVF